MDGEFNTTGIQGRKRSVQTREVRKRLKGKQRVFPVREFEVVSVRSEQDEEDSCDESPSSDFDKFHTSSVEPASGIESSDEEEENVSA